MSRWWRPASGCAGSALAAGVAFAEAAGKVTGMIGSAVDASPKLREFVAPAQTRLLRWRVAARGPPTPDRRDEVAVTADAITAAGVFSEGAGRAVSFTRQCG